MTSRGRELRTAAADRLCAEAYADHGGPDVGVALVAVGGYGRSELAPHSDLDVVLVHDDDVEVGELAERVWYPLWDSGAHLDHSVRSFTQVVEVAGGDLRVALGLLDARHLVGDPNLTLRLRTTLLAHWRRHARQRLPELRAMVRRRHELMGELAHVSVPDLKESAGGLRDATVLKALVATWLVDAPHVALERSRQELLDVRDFVQEASGRAGDRVAPEAWDQLARVLGHEDATAAQRHVRGLGRRVTHLSRLTWRRVDSVLAGPAAPPRRRPGLEPVAPGLALASGEVVLDARARPDRDPLLLLRAAAEAAERDVVLAPATAARLARETPAMPDPWPAGARQLLVRLLASGRGMLPVWETLEETGALTLLLPEWERIRSLPHASPIHRFTVDRHVVETCIEASSLIRGVARPDVLVVAALLHDIGKGGLTEHSVAGAPVARAIAVRMGFDDEAVGLIGTLVRWHLMLAEAATTRDPDDPATVAHVTERVGTAEAIALLTALTEADARATAPKAWSTWRAGLVRGLSRRCLAAVSASGGAHDRAHVREPEVPVPEEVLADPGRVAIGVEASGDGARVTVVSGDRLGLLAEVAALFAWERTPVRAARAWTQGPFGVSVWDVADEALDPAVLRQRMAAVAEGRVDLRHRLARPAAARLEPTVVVRPEASRTATVLEVRMDDRPGVVHLVCAALADLRVSVRSAHVSTLGPQGVDVFYLQEDAAGALGDARAAAAAHAVREALAATVA